MPSVSIVMPAYNEEAIIEKSVRDFYDEIVKKIDDCEFIVVDDWSKDNTPIILKNLQKELPKLIVVKTQVNSGHGKALRLGLELAQKDLIFHTDSDYQHDPKEFWKLYPYINDYDFIIGYRQKRQDPVYRQAISRVARKLNSILFGVTIKDANCPFRIYQRSTLRKMLQVVCPDAFAPSIMLSLCASKFGIKIKEVSVTHYARKTGKVSIQGVKLIKICFRCFREMIALKKNLSRRKSIGAN